MPRPVNSRSRPFEHRTDFFRRCKMDLKRSVLAVAFAASLILAGGCAQTESAKKEALRQKYADDSLAVRLPAAADLLERGQVAQARKTLNECMTAEPDNPMVHVLDGRILCAEGHLNQARQAFEQAIALDAECDAAWFHLAALEQSQDNHSDALEHYQQAVRLNPEHIGYTTALIDTLALLDRCSETIGYIRTTLSRSKDSIVLAQAASVCARCGRLDEAVELYKTAIRLTPHDIGILEALAVCYRQQNNWLNAAETYETLLQVAPPKTAQETYLTGLASCYFNAGQYGQALKSYDRLSTIRRDDPDVWLTMAQAAMGADRVDRAADNARRALTLKPGWTQAYAVLGAAQYLKGDYNEALRSFAYLRGDDQLAGFGWFMTGRCYAQLDQTAKARAAYQQAGSRNTVSPLVSHFLNTEQTAHP